MVGEGPPQISQACADELHAEACQQIIDTTTAGLGRPPAQWTLLEVQTTNTGLAAQGCPLLVTPVLLADRAYKSIHFPRPSGDRSPSQTQLYRGYPFTYTGLWTYWWTSTATWKTLTATASAGGVSATVTARPVALIYDPGDGNAAVTCAGPGRPWERSDGNNAPSAGACGYQYHQVTSSPITSTQTIVWKITWTGTGGAAGQFPQLTTSTLGQLNVMQIQTVVTR